MSSDENARPRVPTVGGDPREGVDVDEPSGKTWFRDLDEAVIEADRCIQCGTCVAACPSDSIGIDEIEERPTLVSMCTGCSRCWDFCPRSGLRYERLADIEGADRPADVGRTVAARAHSDATAAAGQDGGAVTALLGELLDAGEIDAALVATESDDQPLKGEAYLATSRAELREAAGSSYNQTMQLGRLHELLDEADLDDPDVAVVGTPCVIEGAAALERYEFRDEASPIALRIALMCTRNFEYDRLRSILVDHGVDLEAVDGLDVTEGDLIATDADGEVLLEESVDAFDAAGLDGCAECADFVGETADISVGNVGSPDEYTTVVVRSERGADAWATGSDGLETLPLDETESLDRLADWNERRARDGLPREFDREGALSIAYREHREAYDGTDCEPEPLNPARVYQYEEWC
ncbi:Coenzyme F420 hydrogenase/dehydrogenase, beta subunit C-terminal domain [Halomicrobium salinisoli]|uniref:Coenzyme F420 hydrogenase/dehydrogenase, beta subunit C-terminal domain n=1 Tax=Halomicrobium salinisoli TaxID=2878391 RepID=UPI001CF04713|nr:Coenzyme F420 hydrogenase/dehydrogenase, beta subunit C-terminal domain [Halomicrobium salinisoli]